MKLGCRVGEFEVRRMLRQGCVMSLWLYNISFDSVVRRVNERAKGRGGKLRDKNGEGWEIREVLYADDTVLVA